MIKRKFRDELDDFDSSVKKEHYRIMKSENRNRYLNYSNENTKKTLLEKQANIPIKIQLIKTEIKNDSKINTNNIKTKKIFGFSFKKPESNYFKEILNYQKIKESEKMDYSPYNKTANKNFRQSKNFKKLLFNSISYKKDEENKKDYFGSTNNKLYALKNILNSPNNTTNKNNKFINNSISSIKINEFKIDDNDYDNNNNNDNIKDNKENEDKNIKNKVIKNFVFSKQKPNDILFEKRHKMNIANYKFRNVDSITNIKISNSNDKKNFNKTLQNKKNQNILNNDINTCSNRNILLNKNIIKNNKIIINNSLKNIRNDNNKKILNTETNINSIKKINVLNNTFNTNKIKNKIDINENLNQNNSEKYNNNDLINNSKIEIKIEDLIMIEERLNDIYIVLNRNNITIDNDASNECIEFFTFYFNCSLKNSFPFFFNNDKNRLIIKSAINLNLFIVIIIYHLSMNLAIFNQLFPILLNIFELLKQNLYLIIKKIHIYYGDSSLLKNEIYFKTLNFIFKKNNILDVNEKEIIIKINSNCTQIVSSLINILNYYEKINNEYYIDFLDIFNRISIINEKDLNNYFYLHLYFQSGKPLPKPNKKYEGKNKINSNKNNQLIVKNIDIKNNERNQKIKNIIMDYKLKQVKSPFITTPCNKKYTLILDLDETLVNVKINENIKDINDISRYTFNLRPGLFSFLNGVKPFYELISFTNASKEYSDVIINQIEKVKKYFDFNFYREHSTLNGNEFVKDISKIGRDIKKMIIVDNVENNFRLNKENGILIAPYKGDETKNDTKLFFLKNILLKINSKDYKDLRIALKDYYSDIKNNITLDNEKN